MTKKTSSLPVLMTPVGAAFHCSTCGDCCRTGWGIHVDERAFHAITHALAHRPHPLPLRGPDTMALRAKPEPSAHAALGRRPDGACVFLDADNLCYLHRHFGPEVKPAPCRTFPFRPVKRPDGVFAPASLSCRAVRQHLSTVPEGADPTEVVRVHGNPALAELAYERYSPGQKALLRPGLTAPIEVVALAEDRMVRLLAEPGLPLSSRVLGVRYLAEALCGLEEKRLAPRHVTLCYEQAIGADFAALRRREAQVVPHMRHHLALLCQLMEDIEASLHLGSALSTRQALSFGFGVPLTEEDHDQLVARLYGWRFTVADTGLLPIVESYLIEHVRASNVTMRHGLLGMAQALTFGAALLRFFACGLAGQRERPVSKEDLMEAIKETDLYYFHNLTVLSRFGTEGPPWQMEVRCAELLQVLPQVPLQTEAPAPPRAVVPADDLPLMF